MNKAFLVTIWTILVLFLQIFVFNNINLFGSINPYIYIAFVIYLPIKTNRFLSLILAFIVGLILDTFSDSGGIHTFSLIFAMYIRLFLVQVIFKRPKQDFMGFYLRAEPFGKIFNYSAILILTHHLILFTLANFSISNFESVILKTAYTTPVTLSIYLIGSFLFTKKQENQ